jgi:hypothetical protein
MGKHIHKKPLGDHAQGYCRPPAHSQFPNQQRSQTKPTPEPRAIATRQFMKDFFTALEEPITITQNGKKTKIPAAVAINKQLVAHAIKGAAWAVRRVCDMQIALIREYESEQSKAQEMLNYLEQQEKNRPLRPGEIALRLELERRIGEARELFETEIRPQRR